MYRHFQTYDSWEDSGIAALITRCEGEIAITNLPWGYFPQSPRRPNSDVRSKLELS